MESVSNIDFGNVIPTAIEFGGRLNQYSGYRSAGRAARQAGYATQAARNLEADALLSQAETQIGIGGIERRDINRETELILSNARAAAAAQTGGATDPGTLRILARIQQEGSYRAAVAMYNREENARGLRIEALTRRYAGQVAAVGGQQQAAAYQAQANTALLQGASSLYDRFGRDFFNNDAETIATSAAVDAVPGYG